MRAKRILDNAIDYEAFSDPYTGLATMIFVQAAADVNVLGGNERVYKNGSMISKWEIVNFLRSEWADELARFVNLDVRALAAYEARLCG